jgi:hypothetical protein
VWHKGLARPCVLARREKKKRSIMGNGTDSFMKEWKCRFCGTEMDSRAVSYPDGEYTRELEFYCPNEKCQGPPELVEKSRLDEAMKIIETLSKPIICGVCLGKPLESGRKCICNGVGTESAELEGFRSLYYELQENFDNLEAELDGVMISVDKWLDGKELKDNPATRAAVAREKALRAIEGRK